jgi:SAM-dependent methyltransferase
VIGRRSLPGRYVEFNQKWGAPDGCRAARDTPLQRRLDEPRVEYGPFAYQIASGTRAFEYPWTFFAADTSPGCRVLDVGGGVSGLQFVFALEGCRVVNVDPFHDGSAGWPAGSARYVIRPEAHDRLNEVFGTDVELVRKPIQDVDPALGPFDRVVCVSVLEHLGQTDAEEAAGHIGRLLAPGGLFVTTVDLFLDLLPFGVLSSNFFGTNLDMAKFVAGSGLELVDGDPRELLGFAEFDRDRIVAQLDDVLVAPKYPVVSQAVVLRKPR